MVVHRDYLALTATVLVAALSLSAPALACMPQLMVPSTTPKAGEACAVTWTLTGIRAVGLSPARVLETGLVVQEIYDGNACYWEANLLVHDCAAGTAMVIGPDMRELMTEPRETGIDRIAAGIDSGALADLATLARRAVAEGYPPALTVPAGSAIAVDGQAVDISCACATYFPGSAGAGR